VPIRQSIGISISVVALTAVIARNGVPKWDEELFIRINDLPDGLVVLAWAPMQAGALAAPLAVAAVLAARNQRPLASRIATNGVSTWLAAKLLKQIADRARPAEAVGSTKIRIGSADSGLGFPSGHAAVATVLARDLSLHASPAARTFAYGLVFLVGVSRVYVGAHYPLDVLGGWALGWFRGDVRMISPPALSACSGEGG